jgi:hypothetical protein
LLRTGKLIALNSKAFDLLLALLMSDGHELSKGQLMQLIWPDQIVEENNLAVHIYNLRKNLGRRKGEQHYIITIPGVGYRFMEANLYRMNAEDGSEVTRLTFGSYWDSQPAVSFDGQWIVYTSNLGKQHTVWKVPLLGGPAVQVTDYESGSPGFAPDGQTIACVLPSSSPAKPASIAIVPVKGGPPLKGLSSDAL